jgi:hypothetical protein
MIEGYCNKVENMGEHGKKGIRRYKRSDEDYDWNTRG